MNIGLLYDLIDEQVTATFAAISQLFIFAAKVSHIHSIPVSIIDHIFAHKKKMD